MANSEEKKYTPILPFDITQGERIRMYDNMPYVHDVDLCNKDTVALESGNVLKFYRCAKQPPRYIGGDPAYFKNTSGSF